MAAPSALSALRVPGSVTAGGAQIGLLAQVEIRRTTQRPVITAEEFGIEVVDMLWTGAVYRLGFALRGFDSAAISAIFPNVSAGSVVFPGAKPAGRRRSNDAVAVVFTPRNSAHPSVNFPNAIPEAAQELVVSFGKNVEHLIQVSFLALRDGSSAGVTWG